MKYLFLIVSLLFVTRTSAQNLTEGNVETAFKDAQTYPVWPRCATNASGDVLVLFGKFGESNLYQTIRSGGNFSTPSKLNATGIDVNINEVYGPRITTGTNHVYIALAARKNKTSMIGLYHSGDGGHSYDSLRTIRISDFVGYPDVACSEDGKYVHLAMMETDSISYRPKYVVLTSSDYGVTFTSRKVVSDTADDVCECCPPDLITRNSSVVLAYRNNNNNVRDIWFSQSIDNGNTFSAPADIDPTNWVIFGCPDSGPSLLLSSDDSISACWMSSENNQAMINLSTAHFQAGSVVQHRKLTPSTPNTTSQNFPVIAGDNHHKMVVWPENSQGKTSTRMMYSHVGAEGLKEFKMKRLDDSTGLNSWGSGPMGPHVSFQNGTFHTVWYNRHTYEVLYKRFDVPNYSTAPGAETIDVAIYPNPASSYLVVQNPHSGMFTVNDVSGQSVLDGKLSSDGYIDLKNLAPGCYFLILEGETHQRGVTRFTVK